MGGVAFSESAIGSSFVVVIVIAAAADNVDVDVDVEEEDDEDESSGCAAYNDAILPTALYHHSVRPSVTLSASSTAVDATSTTPAAAPVTVPALAERASSKMLAAILKSSLAAANASSACTDAFFAFDFLSLAMGLSGLLTATLMRGQKSGEATLRGSNQL